MVALQQQLLVLMGLLQAQAGADAMHGKDVVKYIPDQKSAPKLPACMQVLAEFGCQRLVQTVLYLLLPLCLEAQLCCCRCEPCC